MKNVKKPNKRGKSSQSLRIQTVAVKPHKIKFGALGEIIKEPNPIYESGRRQLHIVHRQLPTQ